MSDQDQTVLKNSPRKIKSSFHIKERGVLIILSGEDLGKTCLLDSEETIIGRDSSCDLVIDDEGVSKEHCVIKAEQGFFFLEDLASSNGTYLDNKKIKKKSLLNDFERIVMGKTIIRFFKEESF
ncbi:MAG: FHA domain-containing protein [Spirochaetales bacterium]|nr:FHA domain-containing protein [Spirochaetales bacterium]